MKRGGNLKRTRLERRTPLGRGEVVSLKRGKLKRGRGMAASREQQDKVRGAGCLVCNDTPADPAHLLPRTHGGSGDAIEVIPLCRIHHDRYDGRAKPYLDLSPYWQRMVPELQYLLGRLGPDGLVRRLRGRVS